MVLELECSIYGTFRVVLAANDIHSQFCHLTFKISGGSPVSRYLPANDYNYSQFTLIYSL